MAADTADIQWLLTTTPTLVGAVARAWVKAVWDIMVVEAITAAWVITWDRLTTL